MRKAERESLHPEVQTVMQAAQLLLLRRGELKLAEAVHVGENGGVPDFGDGKHAYDVAVEAERDAALDLHHAILRFFGCLSLPCKQLRAVALTAFLEKNEVIL